jgi:hypothetical protein
MWIDILIAMKLRDVDYRLLDCKNVWILQELESLRYMDAPSSMKCSSKRSILSRLVGTALLVLTGSL